MRSQPRPLLDVEELLEVLTLEEKASLLSGCDFWHTTPIPRYNIPSVRFSDGPNGVRGTRFFNPVPALCLPCGTGLGATWNPDLLYEVGELLSRECEAKGAHVWLGPTVNMLRSPLNGRGFESFSEDPYLSGVLAGAVIRGVQSRGTLAALKHFVANDQETDKISCDIRMSQRALREIYLKPFQIAIARGGPRVIMASYNKVNGIHASENPKLLQQILREEWNFDGLVLSDWFGTYSCSEALNAGLDVEMPGPSRHRGRQIMAAVSSGKVTKHTLDERARRVLRFVNDAAVAKVSPVETTLDTPESRELNRKAAAESIVLLKNDDGLLPLKVASGDRVAIIGPNAKNAAACGGGSADLRPYYTSSIYNGIRDQLPKDTQLFYEPGVTEHVLLPVLTKDMVTNDLGQRGVSIEFFHEPYWVENRMPFDSLLIPDTSYQLMDYQHPGKGETWYIAMSAHFTPEIEGIYEFGLATFGTSKLYINGNLIIDNETTQTHGGMFFGQGSEEKRATMLMKAGESYHLRVEAGSASTSKTSGPSSMQLPGGAGRLGCCLKLQPAEGIKRSVEIARTCKHVFVVVGLNSNLEKEGMDRTTMTLPDYYDDLVWAVLAAQPDAIVITQAGNPFAMPWHSKAKTLVHSWYGGNESGNAVADVLFGKVNPSGKLPFTLFDRLQDGPSALSFGNDNGSLYYAEGIFVGYRWFEARGIKVAFPFGHGLSYTTFAISALSVSPTEALVDIENSGSVSGAEVLRLYVSHVTTANKTKSRFLRAKRTLAAFAKVHLQPGEKRCVALALTKNSTAVWDELIDSWCCENGTYAVTVTTGEESLEGSIYLERDVFWRGL
ncbi:hypothetical protein FDECE_138 [Fusarium decemcellulare]|nr:hypothetical protein FDECE_138 [Fusarium decemcellulare]